MGRLNYLRMLQKLPPFPPPTSPPPQGKAELSLQSQRPPQNWSGRFRLAQGLAGGWGPRGTRERPRRGAAWALSSRLPSIQLPGLRRLGAAASNSNSENKTGARRSAPVPALLLTHPQIPATLLPTQVLPRAPDTYFKAQTR